MASPIRWFRKHSQFFVVVFGVVLMAIFGLGSIMTTLNPGDLARSAQAENPVVVEWSGGELTEYDLFALRQKHFAARRFLENVYKYAVEQNEGKPFPVSAEQILPIVRPGENPSNNDLNERIMNRYFFAQRAKQEGFIVDEEMVYDYIRQFSGETPISKQNMKELNKQVNNSVQLAGVVRHLQLELLSQQMENMTRGGLAFDTLNQVSVNAISPTEAIELYARTNRKIECRVLPVSIADKLAGVGEPTATELSDLYEQGKYDYRTYNYDTPGFKQLKMAKVQYFAAELETFLQNEMAKVTDEEVQAEYERLVEAEDNLVMRLIPNKKPETEPDSNKNEEQPKDPDAETKTDPAPAPGDDEAESEEGETTESGDDGSSTESDDDAAPAPGEETEAGTDSGDGIEGDSSSGGYTSIGFQDESGQEEPAEDEKPADEEPAESKEAVQESETTEETTEEQSTDDTSADDSSATDAGGQDADKPATGSEESEMSEEETKDAQSSDSTDEAAADDPVIEDEKPKREPKPLAEVADQIKRRMKMQDARKARDLVIDQAEKELRKYQMNINKWEFEKEREGKEDLEQPPVPDFNAVADALGIQFVETELLDQTQIVDEPIGKVTRLEFSNRQPIQINIGEEIFNSFESTAIYQPAVVDNFADGTKYVYWLSKKVDQKIPTLEEAEESIVKYWKHNKAVEAAMADAQAIADGLNSGNKLLADEKPEKSVDTGAFSWFSMFGRFSYGTPRGVTQPGDEFMSTAFGLAQGQAGVAANEPRDTVYVIQVTNTEAANLAEVGTEYLEKNFFMTNQIPREVLSAKAHYRREMNFDWLRKFNKNMDIKVVGQ